MLRNDYSYDEIADTIFSPIYDVITDDIMKHTQMTHGQLLDLGCGGGHLGFSLMQKTNFYGTFADIHPAAIELVGQRAKDFGLVDRVQASVQDVHHMQFPDHSFDLIISRSSMNFWTDQEQAFREIIRVLAPGGKTYIGSGMGNGTLKVEIERKMKKRNPNWPENLNRNKCSLSIEAYQALFETLGIDCHILNSESKGRWIILKK